MMNADLVRKARDGMQMPHLLDIQTRAFESLLQLDAAQQDREDVGLERVFKDLFPITDVHENFSLEFVRYSLGEPKYSVEECIERDMTYSAPLKATLRWSSSRIPATANVRQEHHREGSLPRRAAPAHRARHLRHQRRRARHRLASCTARRAWSSKSRRTPTDSGCISSRIIPFRGSWVEFTVDIHDVIYVHIDKKKKFPATALLRAFGYGRKRDIYRLFFADPRSRPHHEARNAPNSAKSSARSSPRTSRSRVKSPPRMHRSPRRRRPRPNASARKPRSSCAKATN
jgi:DNA-directed RNA polymerase subunit beta